MRHGSCVDLWRGPCRHVASCNMKHVATTNKPLSNECYLSMTHTCGRSVYVWIIEREKGCHGYPFSLFSINVTIFAFLNSSFCFWVVFLAVQRPSRKLHRMRLFSPHFTVQSMGPNHTWPLVIENWFLFWNLIIDDKYITGSTCNLWIS